MRWLRDWLGWAATWTLMVQAPMWIWVAAEAWQERSDPTLDAIPVQSWVPLLAYGVAGAIPVALLVAVAGRGPVRPRRRGLALGSVALTLAAVAWSGFPEADIGGWYVGLSLLAAAAGMAYAVVPDGDRGAGEPPAVLPGLALVLAGGCAVLTCWRGASYWHWDGESAVAYQVSLGLSVALVALGLLCSWWMSLRSRAVRWLLLVVAGPLGAVAVLVGGYLFHDLAVLYRWDEHESAWDQGTPLLLLGVGLVASAAGAWTRRGDLVAWSLASAMGFGVLSLWQQSTWGSVMR